MGMQPIGINSQATYTQDDINDQSGFGLGDRGYDGDGNGAVYVQATAASIPADGVVSISEANIAVAITTGNATFGDRVGVARVAVAASEFFWAVMEFGNVDVLTLTGCAANVALQTTATPGALDDTATTAITGVVLNATNPGSTIGVSATAANNMSVGA